MNNVKKFYALVGCPGAGKSTFKENSGLSKYAISADDIRIELGCIVINEDGTGYIDQSKNGEVFAIFYNRLEEKLQEGETIVVDNTNLDPRDLKKLRKKAEMYGYTFEIILFDISLETLLKRNTDRGYKNVPKERVEEMYEKFLKLNLSNYYIAKTITEADQK